MALPQKVIEQLSREQPKTPGWSGQLLMFSSTIFLISVSVYFGIVFGYRPYLSSEVNKLQDKIQSFSQQIPLEEQGKIISFYSQLVNLRSILGDHVVTSQLFDWLEKNTQVNVYYDKFSLNAMNGQLSLGGVAKTMGDANQQFAIFTGKPEVKRATISDVALDKGEWRFNATLFFDEGYFRESGIPIQ